MGPSAGYPQAANTDQSLSAWHHSLVTHGIPAVGAQLPLLGSLHTGAAAAPAAAPGMIPTIALPSPFAALLVSPVSRVETKQSPVASPAQEAACRQRKAREAQVKKDAVAKAEAERSRCHLHKKPKDNCKFCQRHKEYVAQETEKREAAKERFIKHVRSGRGKSDSASSSSTDPVEFANPKSFGFSPMLQSHIVESSHFKALLGLKTVEEVMTEISTYADTLEPHVHNSNTIPSALFCCIYRFMTMSINTGQLKRLIEHEHNVFIRCAGFLLIRFGLAPEQLWSWLGEYVLDEQEIPASGKECEAGAGRTIGEFVESLLTQERYFSAVLPRVTSATKRLLEPKLAQVPQDRLRSKANQRLLDVYREPGIRVEVLVEDEWREGDTVELYAEVGTLKHRPKIRIRFDASSACRADGDCEAEAEEVVVQLGRIILTDKRCNSQRSRRNSRSRSPSGRYDLSRHRGKSGTELLEDVRRRSQDIAVCSAGKDYAKRPVSFQVALPMDHGNAYTGLTQDGAHSHDRRLANRADFERERPFSSEPTTRSREQSVEYQQRMRQLYEKYGAARTVVSEDESKRRDIEGPDVVRLG